MTAKCCYHGLSSRGRGDGRGARLFQSTVEVVRTSEVAVAGKAANGPQQIEK